MTKGSWETHCLWEICPAQQSLTSRLCKSPNRFVTLLLPKLFHLYVVLPSKAKLFTSFRTKMHYYSEEVCGMHFSLIRVSPFPNLRASKGVFFCCRQQQTMIPNPVNAIFCCLMHRVVRGKEVDAIFFALNLSALKMQNEPCVSHGFPLYVFVNRSFV